MPTQIPSVTGVPGISGPPDWFTPPPPFGENYRLDDVRWFGATQRTFGAGASPSATFRAISDTSGGQPYLFLSFQANFVPALSDNRDFVYLGLQLAGGATAMVVRFQVHGPLPVARAGTPLVDPADNSRPPVNLQSVQVSTRASSASSWSVQTMSPAWINTNTRVWIQSDTDFSGPPPFNDPNNRWAVQVRIPLSTSTDILNAAGPNLGSAFPLWYLVQGALADGSRVILADTATPPTTALSLTTGNYPVPAGWEPYLTGAGPATTGGVSIYGNGWNDILVHNALGDGTTIQNGQANTFIARPRNYRTPGSDIAAGQINVTFRMANWGSVANDPNQINFASGSWDYVQGNSAIVPVLSNALIPVLTAGADPMAAVPPVPEPVNLLVPALTLGANKSKHQCIMVTLSGAGLNILTESAYRNMNFDHASLVEREAEINLENLKPFSAAPRSIRLGIERLNLPAQLPAGYDEKQFLAATLDRLIKAGGPLAKKLAKTRSLLDRAGDYGSAKRLQLLLKLLGESLGYARSRLATRNAAPLKSVLAEAEAWLGQTKDQGVLSEALATLLTRFSDWLLAAPAEREAKLADALAALAAWLGLVRANPKTVKATRALIKALQEWASTLANGEVLTQALQSLEKYLTAAKPTAALLAPWQSLVKELSLKNGPVQTGLSSWLDGAARWVKGSERLDYFLSTLSAAGVTGGEIDRIFPSVRIHVYYDTGERETGPGGKRLAVWRSQPSFGLAAYHEGALTGWQVGLDGADRIAPNLYQLPVPNLGRVRIKLRILARGKEDKELKEDPIVRPPPVK